MFSINQLSVGHQVNAGDIIHDGEFNFVKAQHAKAWDLQDKRVDARLAEIQKQQSGKRPNILYILVDDVGFGDFGIPELNYVRGTQTPRIVPPALRYDYRSYQQSGRLPNDRVLPDPQLKLVVPE